MSTPGTNDPNLLVDELRNMLADDAPEKNILNNGQEVYSDTKLLTLLNQALRDINRGSPRTAYTIETIPDPQLLLDGAVIFSLIAEGILQLRNHLDYNDAGLSLGMFNKTDGYQGWSAFLLQQYVGNKMDFKRSVLPSTSNAGFYGVRSPFSSDWGLY